jgi:hypothetical protein
VFSPRGPEEEFLAAMIGVCFLSYQFSILLVLILLWFLFCCCSRRPQEGEPGELDAAGGLDAQIARRRRSPRDIRRRWVQRISERHCLGSVLLTARSHAGTGVEKAFAGIPAAFSVQTRDEFGVPVRLFPFAAFPVPFLALIVALIVVVSACVLHAAGASGLQAAGLSAPGGAQAEGPLSLDLAQSWQH